MTNVAQRENKPSPPDLRTVPQGGSVDAVTTRASTDSAQSLQVPSRVEIAGALAGHKETLREQGKVLSEVLTALSSIEAACKQSEQSISSPPIPGRIEDVTSYSIPQLEQLYARTCKDLSEQTKGLALLHQKFSRAKEEFEAETTSADGLDSGERYAQRASALLSLAVSYKSLHSTFAVTDSNHRELVSAIPERFLKEQGFNSSSDLLKATYAGRKALSVARGILGVKGLFKRKEVAQAKATCARLESVYTRYKEMLRHSPYERPEYPPSLYDLSTKVGRPLANASNKAITLLREAAREMRDFRAPALPKSSADISERRADPQMIVKSIIQNDIIREGKDASDREMRASACQAVEKFFTEGFRYADDYNAEKVVQRYLEHTLKSGDLLEDVRRSLLWSAVGPEISAVSTTVRALGITLSDRADLQRASLRQQGDPTGVGEAVIGAYQFESYSVKTLASELRELLPSHSVGGKLDACIKAAPELHALVGKLLGEGAPMLLPDTQERREAVSRSLVTELLTRGLTTSVRDDQALRIWPQVFRSREYSMVPFALIQAFRDPGYSNNYPFLSPSGGPVGYESKLAEKAARLSAQELEALRSFPVPALYNAYTLIKEHGQQALSYQSEVNGKYEPNPLNIALQREVEAVVVHYLRRGAPDEQVFAAETFRWLSHELAPSTVSAMIEVLDSSVEPRVLSALIDFTTYNLSIHAREHLISKALVAASLTALPRATEVQSLEEAAQTLFFKLPKETQELPSITKTVAAIFSCSSEAVLRASDLRERWLEVNTRDLLASSHPTPVGNATRSLSLESYIRLAAIDRFPEALGALLDSESRAKHLSQGITALVLQVAADTPFRDPVSHASGKALCAIAAHLCDTNGFEHCVNARGEVSDAAQHERFGKAALALSKLADSGASLDHILKQAKVAPESTFAALRGIASLSPEVLSAVGEPEVFATLVRALPKHQHLDALADLGMPLLCSLGWVTPESLKSLHELLPKFLRENASSADCWHAYKAVLDSGNAPFLKYGGVTPAKELMKLLEYNRNFPGLRLAAVYDAFRVIGEPGSEAKLRDLGFKNVGSHTLNELKTKVRTMREEILRNEGAIDIATPLEKELLVATIGHAGDASLIMRRAEVFKAAAIDGRVAPLDSRFQDQTFQVDTLDMDKVRAFSFSEPTLARYEVFRRELLAMRSESVRDLLKREKENVDTLLRRELDAVEGALLANASLSAGERKGRQMEISRLKDTIERLEKSDSLPDFVVTLCDYKQKDNPITTPSLRRFTLRMALDELSNQNGVLNLLDAAPSKEALEAIVGLVNTNLKEEALAQLPLTDKQRKVIHQSVSTAAFVEDFERLSKIGSAGKETILAHPTRGLLGELSGFNCNACWTRQEGIMERYPNATAVMFVRAPEDEQRKRLVGGCILLKVRDTDGNDTFVVRGINPTENFITQLKPDSFFESYLDQVVVPMARAQGVTRIVIPNDASSGSAQTNRPTLNAYIRLNYGQNPAVQLDPDGPNSQFNNYPILDRCVLVRKLS